MTAGTEAEGNGDGSGNSNGCPANAGRYRRKYFWFDEGSARGFWTLFLWVKSRRSGTRKFNCEDVIACGDSDLGRRLPPFPEAGKDGAPRKANPELVRGRGLVPDGDDDAAFVVQH